MLPYAAYLRVYEPLAAFPEPERSRWAAYAASGGVLAAGAAGVPTGKRGAPPGQHVRRAGHLDVLEAEHAEALRRIIAVPPIVAPPMESGHAYVRQADGAVYVCPWQTRLRSWLALGRLRATLPPAVADTFVPRRVADLTAADFARWHAQGPSIRTHILTATWHVPLSWFVPFSAPERWLVLGAAGRDKAGRGPASPTRALVYATAMSQARKRVALAVKVVRRRAGRDPDSGAAERMSKRLAMAAAEIEEVGRWLEEFHPRSLVELDYGGLVQMLDDEALRGDESAAEVAAAITSLENGELELARAMYQRLQARWRPMRAMESAS